MRRRKWLKGIVVLALLVGLTAWALRRAARQERLDRALIHAVHIANAKRVADLLAQGADPNAREKPNKNAQANLSLWQRFLALFRPPSNDRSPYTSALWIASRRDFDRDKEDIGQDADSALALSHNKTEVEEIVHALLHSGARALTDTSKAAPALAWAGHYWRSLPKELLDHLDSPQYIYNSDFRDDVENILYKYGPSADAYLLLARYSLQGDHYAEAAHFARMALLFQTAQNEAQFLLAQAESRIQMAQGVAALLPTGSEILHMRPYPVLPDTWVVVSAQHGRKEDYWFQHKTVLLTLCCEQNGHFHKIQQIGDFSEEGTVYEAYLFVADLTGDGVPEVILHQLSPGADSAPSQMDIFAWRNGTLTSILCANGTAPLWLEDPKGNHRYTVCNSYRIGSIYLAKRLYWNNLYAYRNGRYMLANADYPARFTAMRKELQDALKSYPHDYLCREYLAYIETLQGDKTAAQRDYGLATQDCKRQIAQEAYPETRRIMRDELRDLHTARRTLPDAPPGSEQE